MDNLTFAKFVGLIFSTIGIATFAIDFAAMAYAYILAHEDYPTFVDKTMDYAIVSTIIGIIMLLIF